MTEQQEKMISSLKCQKLLSGQTRSCTSLFSDCCFLFLIIISLRVDADCWFRVSIACISLAHIVLTTPRGAPGYTGNGVLSDTLGCSTVFGGCSACTGLTSVTTTSTTIKTQEHICPILSVWFECYRRRLGTFVPTLVIWSSVSASCSTQRRVLLTCVVSSVIKLRCWHEGGLNVFPSGRVLFSPVICLCWSFNCECVVTF